jgi:acyl-CoA thioesterase FadM
MINWFRFFSVWIKGSLSKPLKSITDDSVLALRVGFFDADLTIANNASLLRLMELGRLDLMVRSGFLKQVLKNRWSLPLASAYVVYIRPMRRWQKFTLKTRVLTWQDEWVFLEHTLTSQGKRVGRALMRATCLEQGKKQPVQEIFDRVGYDVKPSPLTPELKALMDLERIGKESASS